MSRDVLFWGQCMPTVIELVDWAFVGDIVIAIIVIAGLGPLALYVILFVAGLLWLPVAMVRDEMRERAIVREWSRTAEAENRRYHAERERAEAERADRKQVAAARCLMKLYLRDARLAARSKRD